jgi:hypothetical protein
MADNARTIKIELKITHTDHKGQTREIRESRVYPTTGDNPSFIDSDVNEKYNQFHGDVTVYMVNNGEVWR